MTENSPLHELRRRFEADPENPRAHVDWLLARARIEGPNGLLEILLDRQLWNSAPEAVQDIAGREVERRYADSLTWTATKLYQCGNTSHRIFTFTSEALDVSFQLLPAGRFKMGTDSDDQAYENEKPCHEVHIRRPFLMATTLITQKQWGQPVETAHSGEHRPVESVSWDDVTQWCRDKTLALRLPSESEWEYACRAGTNTRFFWGDRFDPDYAWNDKTSGGITHPVQEHLEHYNAFGLIDMAGNVWEWVADDWVRFYRNGPDTEQARTTDTVYKTIRGGGWSYFSRCNRSAHRGNNRHEVREPYIGFRPVLDIPRLELLKP